MFDIHIPEKDDLLKLYAQIEPGQLSMLYAVCLGLKPLMDTFLRYEHFLALKEKAKTKGILFGHNGIMMSHPQERFLRRKERRRNLGTTKMIAIPFDEERKDALVHAFISRSPDKIEEARKLTWYNLFVGEHQLVQPAIDNFRYGATLGFPDCCVRFYAGHNGRFLDDNHTWEWNTPFEVYRNTRGEFSFLCNHIPMDHCYFLIHHYPCSYNCPETIKLAGDILEGIRSIDREYGDKIERYLKLPYLLFNEKKAFVFEGEIKGNRITYSDCHFLGDKRDLATYMDITKGDCVEVHEDYIVVFRGSNEITRYPLEGDFEGKIYKFG
ncbi:MAG: DUF483 domain-containing protein [Candidatus Eremiobacteraeota bacterium]|nr:DUF483 domain-containing protein [Candidatus Eremiobacteraeota bacterium]